MKEQFKSILSPLNTRCHCRQGSLDMTDLCLMNDKRHGSKILKQVQEYPFNNGFTLIELLVVILIIGILAAVALPQYQLAVAKARVSKLIVMTRSVVQVQESYYLANGEYTIYWDHLDLSFNGTVINHELQSDGWVLSLHSNKVWQGAANGVQAIDNSVPNIKIFAFYAHEQKMTSFRGIVCVATRSDTQATALCKNLSHNTYGYGTGTEQNPAVAWRIE